MNESDIPEEISADDLAWQLEGDDSVGDAEDPHRNDDVADVIDEPAAENQVGDLNE